jgi:Mg-chelatase subunit ChlD
MRSSILTYVLVAAAVFAMSAHAVGETRGVDYVLLVDNTGTMKYADRGTMTLKALESFIDQTRAGDRVSVYCYGEKSYSVLSQWPVTIENRASKDRLKSQLSFSFSADRTDITSGMELVWNDRDRVFPNRSRSGNSVLVLMTDGKLIPNYSDYSQYDSVYHRSLNRLKELAGLFGRENVTVYTIGVGRSDKIDGDLLKSIASKADGDYFYVATADGVPGAYASVLAARPDEVEAAPASLETPERYASGDETQERRTGLGWSIQDQASASETQSDEERAAKSAAVRASKWVAGFPVDTCHRIAGALAILVGVVAVGAEKRRKWATHFTADLFGTGEMRVRGFLKPVDPPGVATARPCIGLENPGLDKVKLGVDTSIPSHAAEVEITFVGTKDGSPPTMVVTSGSVTLDGEAVEKCKLADGDLIEIEGLQYQYLRGSRR